MLERNFRMF